VRELDLLQDGGVLVLSAEAGTPAGRAGVQEGDVLIELAERPVTSVDDLHRLLPPERIGQRIEITVLRDRQIVRLWIKPAEAP
jgi:S1-C subfamily serine protease